MIHYRFREKQRELLGFIQTEPVLNSLLFQMKEHHFPTYQHLLRVALVAEDLAERLGFNQGDCYNIKKGSLLHDAGKVRVARDILDAKIKPEGKNWELMKNHVAFTRDILLEYGVLDKKILYIALAHHEFQTESYSRQANRIWPGDDRRSIDAKTKDCAQIVVVSDKLDASLYRKDQLGLLTPEEKIRRDFTGDHSLISEVMKYAA
ncbi:MAG: HD domain-containing protein [bacterium]|nr:HD domain-containing protein [bacterium]